MFDHFLIEFHVLGLFFILTYMSFYILVINPLLVALFANIFSQSIGLFFLFIVSLAVQKLIRLIWSYLLYFLLFLLPWETDLEKIDIIYVWECFAYVPF